MLHRRGTTALLSALALSVCSLAMGQAPGTPPQPVPIVTVPQLGGPPPNQTTLLPPGGAQVQFGQRDPSANLSMQQVLANQPNIGPLDPTVRVKDITFVEGDRVNHVSGEGLVFGLSGTGGMSEQTRQMATNYFLRRGMQIGRANTQNMSAVMVSGKIPAYARKGETILVTVSVADDAASLRGGTLNQTALRGIDDQIYAIAQGPIIGGGVAAGGNAAQVVVNHPTVGVCEAILEREIDCGAIVRHGRIRLILRNKSYTTATLIANQLNGAFPQHGRALDSGTVEVTVPRTFLGDLPAFISMIGDLRVRPDMPARVVINQKTGTVVMGHNVKISTAVFASENIVIATNETPIASQPAPFSQGQTVILPRTNIDIVESGGSYNLWNEALTVGDLANALNALAVSPNTLVNMFTSLRNQGALQAELVIE